MFAFVFVTFPYGVLGKVWYLIVSNPDLCILPYSDVDETFRRCIDVGAALCRHSPCRILFRSGKTDKNDKCRVGSMITSSWRSGAFLTLFINIYGKKLISDY